MDFSQAVVASDEAWVKPRMRMVAGAVRSRGRVTVWPSSAVPVVVGMVRVRSRAARRAQSFMCLVETIVGLLGRDFVRVLMG